MIVIVQERIFNDGLLNKLSQHDSVSNVFYIDDETTEVSGNVVAKIMPEI